MMGPSPVKRPHQGFSSNLCVITQPTRALVQWHLCMQRCLNCLQAHLSGLRLGAAFNTLLGRGDSVTAGSNGEASEGFVIIMMTTGSVSK